jgi:hypothetical protein
MDHIKTYAVDIVEWVHGRTKMILDSEMLGSAIPPSELYSRLILLPCSNLHQDQFHPAQALKLTVFMSFRHGIVVFPNDGPTQDTTNLDTWQGLR